VTLTKHLTQLLFVLSQQSFVIPLELKKSSRHVSQESAKFPPLRKRNSSNVRRLQNARALIVLADVCLYWKQIFATSSSSSRQQLRRVFDC
jgi:hypothetical protein